ncbi:DUF6250 domain-containing protein [Sphingomonas abietis]|uniref:DUF6250 domain-containing protein n=1 Tax=Sphingomonas abietis TaxID=3012344 RepID=A0ABY7NQB9_9SPHN|nr:DUF6250 domain-containing protein [Sphingomonas abietis]WBO23739.1 DUF6250 domain-containing protein [Sphingomonas abietis]
MTRRSNGPAHKSARWAGLLLAAPLVIAASPADDFRHGLAHWRAEAEAPAQITAQGGILDIVAPKGLTLWYDRPLTGPVEIDYDVEAVAEGGVDDAVSDVNAFWMASDADDPGATHPPRPRSGRFADYDDLRTYYVGIGGNRNSTTRLRRYVGQAGDRPILPGNDRRDAAALLQPNRWMHIRLIADGHRVAVLRDGKMLFGLDDDAPYRHGYFALRTTASHLRVRRLRIRSVTP